MAVLDNASLTIEDSKPRYAGFWIRLCAQFIDGLILGFAGLIIGLVFGLGLAGMEEQLRWIGILLLVIVALCIGWLYSAGFESSSHMGTPGKMVCGIKVIDAEGNRISFLRASIRFVFKSAIISVLRLVHECFACMGFIYLFTDVSVIAINENKQSIHDMIVGTLVVYK